MRRKPPNTVKQLWDRPKCIELKLDQIISYGLDPKFSWLRDLRHLPQATPALLSEALPLIELCHPLIVMRDQEMSANKSQSSVFRLVSGYRTLQLLRESKEASKIKIWALELPQLSPEKLFQLRVFDSITAKIVNSPDGSDLALIGGTVMESRELHEELSRQLLAQTCEQLAAQMGMSRATLFRVSKPVRQAINDNRPGKRSQRKPALEANTKQGAERGDE